MIYDQYLLDLLFDSGACSTMRTPSSSSASLSSLFTETLWTMNRINLHFTVCKCKGSETKTSLETWGIYQWVWCLCGWCLFTILYIIEQPKDEKQMWQQKIAAADVCHGGIASGNHCLPTLIPMAAMGGSVDLFWNDPMI